MNDNVKKALITAVLGAIGFYFGGAVWDALWVVPAVVAANAPDPGALGPLSYDTLTFPDEAALSEYVRFVRARRLYPWLLWGINNDMALLVLGAAMGMAGGAVEFLRRWLYKQARLTVRDAWSYALLGSIAGFTVLFTAVALPKATALVGVSSLAGVGFFSGMFSETAFAWVRGTMAQMVRKEEGRVKIDGAKSHSWIVGNETLNCDGAAVAGGFGRAWISSKESGVFRMEEPSSNQTIYLFVQRSGNTIEGYDVATSTPFKSAVDPGGGFSMNLFLPKSNKSMTAKVTGEISHEQLQVSVPGWTAGTILLVKVPYAWHCGNHPIKHVAESPEQMKQFTKAEGCGLWRPVLRQ